MEALLIGCERICRPVAAEMEAEWALASVLMSKDSRQSLEERRLGQKLCSLWMMDARSRYSVDWDERPRQKT